MSHSELMLVVSASVVASSRIGAIKTRGPLLFVPEGGFPRLGCCRAARDERGSTGIRNECDGGTFRGDSPRVSRALRNGALCERRVSTGPEWPTDRALVR